MHTHINAMKMLKDSGMNKRMKPNQRPPVNRNRAIVFWTEALSVISLLAVYFWRLWLQVMERVCVLPLMLGESVCCGQ